MSNFGRARASDHRVRDLSIQTSLSRTPGRLDGANGFPTERMLERHQVKGLDEVIVEASSSRTLLVIGLAIAGQRDKPNAMQLRHCAQPLCELVPIHLGKSDIEQPDIGLERLKEL